MISGTISDGGSFTPTVTVGNGTSSTSASFNWTVGSTITITDNGDQAFNAGDAVSVPITATDTAAGTLTFSASGLPSGTSINSSTGLISGTMRRRSAPASPPAPSRSRDGTNTAVDAFTWTISAAGDLDRHQPGEPEQHRGRHRVSLSISTTYTGAAR